MMIDAKTRFRGQTARLESQASKKFVEEVLRAVRKDRGKGQRWLQRDWIQLKELVAETVPVAMMVGRFRTALLGPFLKPRSEESFSGGCGFQTPWFFSYGADVHRLMEEQFRAEDFFLIFWLFFADDVEDSIEGLAIPEDISGFFLEMSAFLRSKVFRKIQHCHYIYFNWILVNEYKQILSQHLPNLKHVSVVVPCAFSIKEALGTFAYYCENRLESFKMIKAHHISVDRCQFQPALVGFLTRQSSLKSLALPTWCADEIVLNNTLPSFLPSLTKLAISVRSANVLVQSITSVKDLEIFHHDLCSDVTPEEMRSLAKRLPALFPNLCKLRLKTTSLAFVEELFPDRLQASAQDHAGVEVDLRFFHESHSGAPDDSLALVPFLKKVKECRCIQFLEIGGAPLTTHLGVDLIDDPDANAGSIVDFETYLAPLRSMLEFPRLRSLELDLSGLFLSTAYRPKLAGGFMFALFTCSDTLEDIRIWFSKRLLRAVQSLGDLLHRRRRIRDSSSKRLGNIKKVMFRCFETRREYTRPRPEDLEEPPGHTFTLLQDFGLNVITGLEDLEALSVTSMVKIKREGRSDISSSIDDEDLMGRNFLAQHFAKTYGRDLTRHQMRLDSKTDHCLFAVRTKDKWLYLPSSSVQTRSTV